MARTAAHYQAEAIIVPKLPVASFPESPHFNGEKSVGRMYVISALTIVTTPVRRNNFSQSAKEGTRILPSIKARPGQRVQLPRWGAEGTGGKLPCTNRTHPVQSFIVSPSPRETSPIACGGCAGPGLRSSGGVQRSVMERRSPFAIRCRREIFDDPCGE